MSRQHPYFAPELSAFARFDYPGLSPENVSGFTVSELQRTLRYRWRGIGTWKCTLRRVTSGTSGWLLISAQHGQEEHSRIPLKNLMPRSFLHLSARSFPPL